MTSLDNRSLLGDEEPTPALTFNVDGRSAFLILGDHAGNAIPRVLGGLDLSIMDRARHIAWDIGVHDLGMALAADLDATFIHQHYSRLVIDCNRDPRHPQSTPAMADGTPIAQNDALSDADKQRRIAAIHVPYHQRIASELAGRAQAGRRTILLALHSFTPQLAGETRPWHIGILHSDGANGFAVAMLTASRTNIGMVVGDNQPHRMDNTDYTVPHHAFASGVPYAEIEVRQDLLIDADGIATWCRQISTACQQALLLCR